MQSVQNVLFSDLAQFVQSTLRTFFFAFDWLTTPSNNVVKVVCPNCARLQGQGKEYAFCTSIFRTTGPKDANLFNVSIGPFPFT